MNDYSVNNDKRHFAGTEQKLRKRTPKDVLQVVSKNRWCRRFEHTVHTCGGQFNSNNQQRHIIAGHGITDVTILELQIPRKKWCGKNV